MKALKIILGVVGGLVAVVLAAIIIIPFVVDVDQYRPQVVAMANERLNGKLEVGKFKLTLWGRIRVQVDGVKIQDAAGKAVVAVKDAYFDLPLSSVWSGSPEMVFRMEKPEITATKNKKGELNLSQLAKSAPVQPAAAPGSAGGAAPTESGPKKGVELPSIAKKARFTFELLDATFVYSDETTALKSKLDDFNLRVKDISLSRPIQLEMWADFKASQGSEMQLQGPFRLSGTINPTLEGVEFKKADVQMAFNAADLEIMKGDLFKKRKGVPFKMDLEMTATPQVVDLKKFEFIFHNAVIKAQAKVVNAPNPSAAPDINATVESNEIVLQAWTELVPMLKDYELTGKAKLKANAKTAGGKLDYAANFKMEEVTAKAAQLKTKPKFSFQVDVVPDEVKSMLFTMSAPGNDLSVKGRVVSFTKPQITLNVDSQSLDLNQLVEFPPEPSAAPGAKGEAKKSESKETVANATPAPDYDGQLKPLRENPMLKGLVFNLNLNLNSIKAKKYHITGFKTQFQFKDLVAAIQQFQMGIFSGTIASKGNVDLKPAEPTYQLDVSVQQLNLTQAIESGMEGFKNTVDGKFNFAMNGSGRSLNQDKMMKNLNFKGNLKVAPAKFRTIDMGKVTAEAINQGIEKVAAKVPQAGGKKVNTPGGRSSEYEFIGADFTISAGKFNMPNFVAKSMPGQSIDIEGSTELDLISQEVKAKWKVIDTHNLTGARDLSVEAQGVRVEHLLSENGQAVQFPVTVGCKTSSPCFNYTEVPGHFVRVAGENVAKAVEGKAKALAQEKLRQAEEAARAAVKNNPAVQNTVKDVKKKLFGR